MKFNNILIGSALVAACVGCKDQMEYNEYSIDGEEYISNYWSRVAGFMTTIYNNIDYDFGQTASGANLSSATDESVYSHAGNTIETYYNGSWSPTSNLNPVWSSAWQGIAYCNLVLDKFDGLTFPEYIEDKAYAKNLFKYRNYKYECRWARAYFYYILARSYGGVPLKTSDMDAETSNALPRLSTDEIFDFVISECDAIKDSIIKDYSDLGIYAMSTPETGRANDLTVMALKARAALYKASPLFNTDNDSKRWTDAVEACQEVIDACVARGKQLDADYASLFGEGSKVVASSKELIFARRVAAANSYEKYNFPIGLENAGGGNCPTQNLVDAYEMLATGKAIDEEGSGYDPANPYEGRDPRLAATVAVNGERWPDALAEGAVLETYYGGSNALPKSYGTPTGYYLKKYVVPSTVIANTGSNTKTHAWIIFRLAELYLDYAEAALEATGSGYSVPEGGKMTAAEAINVVRKRAGLPNIAEGLSADDFKKKYRNERFVELAFEGHRFFDIRRWKAANSSDYLTIRGMDVTMNPDSTFNYSPVVLDNSRTWNDKQYLYPIPQSDLLKSAGGWEQNPGW